MQQTDSQSRASEKQVIAVDLDSTLAQYHSGDMQKNGHSYVGKPIPAMVAKVRYALGQGAEVFIFTARTNPSSDSFEDQLDATKQVLLVAQWCQEYLGRLLPVTHEKLRSFTQIWDDRGKEVIPNTGVFLSELADAAQGK